MRESFLSFSLYALSLPLPLINSMLKVAVFGVGHLGKFHLNNWREIPGVELVGFYDPNDETAEEVVTKYNLKRFTDEDRLIAASDAVDIIAPTNFHFELCEKAIRKGRHVFVEKPLANSIYEAQQMVAAVKMSLRWLSLATHTSSSVMI